jgi:TRAP-type mannitol/chloroaromatic compound transport system permease large subunit
MSVLTLFLAALFGFILLTVPIAFALFLTALVLALTMGVWSPALIIQSIFRGIDSFPLMAIPFFLLAGEIMNTGGISERIIMVAKAMCGHVRGGLGYVTVVASMLISGVSGSAVADTSAIGSILYPVMKKEGYDPLRPPPWLPPPPPTDRSSRPRSRWSSSGSSPTFRSSGCLSAVSFRA